MRQVSIDYSNTQNLINNLRSILRNLDNEKREVNSALRELYDLENYYYNKGEIVQELEYRQRKISKDIESTEELIDNISRFLNEVKETDGNLANKFKQDIKAYAKKNNIDLVSGFERFLNKLQTGLDIVGCLPVIGDIADAINGVISLARGDIGTALISFIAVVPFVGDAAKGLKYLDKASGLLKLGDKVVDIGKATVKNTAKKVSKTVKKEVLGIASKGEKVFKNVLESVLDLGKGNYVTWIKNKGEVLLNAVNDKLPKDIQICLNGGCLLGNTLVRTENGLKEIREIKVGDLVLSKNEKLGITEYKKVTELHRNSIYETCIIKTRNSIIEATTGHLFMIKDKWWIAAIDIKENDYIELSNGEHEKIVSVRHEKREYPVKIYNLTVKDNHNYYVGNEEILTHNTIKLKKNYNIEVGNNPELKLIKNYERNSVFSKAVTFKAGEDGTGITYKVFQRNDIEWDRIRKNGAKKGRGLTNAEAAEKYGLAPILDEKGSIATLHHSQQHSIGPLFEASTRYHNISNAKKAPLHPYKGKLNPFNPMKEEVRNAFQKVDSIEYWKTRGRDAMKGVK
ncbi:polymorphic toxin-type HINT domain-containing protein [Clostridium perfringens]|uniref:polymorphic toxin-type HINT domain-containing protein n=1 Tax=Clostridium perfringens TaxID=1502 RepID=UPI0018999C75|nr:polymorphic toxin-type HINT domain-containing protein [Clostridium perfringens]